MKKYNVLIFSGIGISFLVIFGILNQFQNVDDSVNPVDESVNPVDESLIEKVNIFKQEESVEEIISDKLNEIQEKNEEFEFTPKPREWIKSGPFSIDRSEYILGEKIFFTIGPLSSTEKGQIVFLNPLNSTHYHVYLTYSFDGMKKNTSNLYFEPSLSKAKLICDKSELIGEWRVVFRGTDYENLEFSVIDDIMPGDEKDFEPVC